MSDVQNNEPTDEEIPNEALDEVAGGLVGDSIPGGGGGGGSGYVVVFGGNGGAG